MWLTGLARDESEGGCGPCAGLKLHVEILISRALILGGGAFGTYLGPEAEPS